MDEGGDNVAQPGPPAECMSDPTEPAGLGTITSHKDSSLSARTCEYSSRPMVHCCCASAMLAVECGVPVSVERSTRESRCERVGRPRFNRGPNCAGYGALCWRAS